MILFHHYVLSIFLFHHFSLQLLYFIILASNHFVPSLYVFNGSISSLYVASGFVSSLFWRSQPNIVYVLAKLEVELRFNISRKHVRPRAISPSFPPGDNTIIDQRISSSFAYTLKWLATNMGVLVVASPSSCYYIIITIICCVIC